MKKEQEQQIVGYYSTTDKYIRSKLHSNAHQSVFTKESDRYQWLVLEQKSQSEVEVRQTDSHGTITARDNYELTRNIPKCVSVERLCEGANLSAILPQIKDNQTKRIVNTTLDKLNALSETSCKELTATTKRRKIAERDHSIRARLAKAKEQAKQPTVTGQKRHRTHSKGKGDMEL